MQDTKNSQPGKKKPLSKVVLIGGIGIVVLLPFAVWNMFCAVVPDAGVPDWQRDSNQAIHGWNRDPAASEKRMRQAITEAENAHAPDGTMLQLHRDFATRLYWDKRNKEGDEQIDQAIASLKAEPGPGSSEASGLSHAYQDRGWFNYMHWVADRSGSDGVADQEKSVAVADKYFGPDSGESVYKLASLVLMYADTKNAKAKAAMDRLLDTIETKKQGHGTEWFAYAMIAHTKALARDYVGATQAYLTAMKFARGNNADSDRCFEEFSKGLSRQIHDNDPRTDDAHELLSRGKFDELDRLSDEFIRSKEELWSGKWKIDKLILSVVQDDAELQDADFRQNIFDIKQWIKHSPQSPAARIALARCYVLYAWHARGSGWADSVSKEAWQQMAQRLALSREILEQDPSIYLQCPVAFTVRANVALGESMDKDEYMRLVERSDKVWPTYVGTDISACGFLLPRWFGSPGEWVEFAKSRAESVGGVAGDVWYARLINGGARYYSNVLSEEKTVSWPRVKAGFKQLCADFPRSMSVRVQFLKFAHDVGDDDVVKTLFDGYKNSI